jgi:CHAT domain-containing protein/tetratricopeptide (TPR) repeat protein
MQFFCRFNLALMIMGCLTTGSGAGSLALAPPPPGTPTGVQVGDAEADRQLQAAIEQFRTPLRWPLTQRTLEQALRRYQASNNPDGQLKTLTYLVLGHYQAGEFEAASWHLQAAERWDPASLKTPQLASLRGLLALERGEYGPARIALQRAAGQQFANLEAEVRNQIGLGTVYRAQGNYPRALDQLQLAARTPAGRLNQAWALSQMGDVYAELGQFQAALDQYQQAVDVHQAIGDQFGRINQLRLIRTYTQMSRMYGQLGQFDQALRVNQQAADWTDRNNDFVERINVWNSLGLLQLAQGNRSAALAAFQSALQATDRNLATRQGKVESLNNLGLYYYQGGEYESALAAYEEAIQWAQKLDNRAGEAKALSGKGQTQLRLKQPQQATTSLRSSITLYESLRPGLEDHNQIALFETQSYAYGALQSALIQQGQPTAALEASERGRARAFVELLARRDTVEPPTVQPPNLAEIQATAKRQNTTLVTYSTVESTAASTAGPNQPESTLYIWVVSPQGKVAFRSASLKGFPQAAANTRVAAAIGLDAPASVFGQTVMAMRGARSARASIGIIDATMGSDGPLSSAISRTSRAADTQIANRRAYDLLIGSIQDLLPSDPLARITFIPQGSLFLVPFQALQGPDGKYLIERHTIMVAPSIQALSLLQSRATSPGALVIGNPTPMAHNLPALPGAQIEAENIAKLLNVQALIGPQATKAAVLGQIARSGVIHFATHGLLDDRNSLQSALALVSDPQDSGLLTAQEIFGMKLQANLAVLSACNTGRGQITGDGVLGLSRSLLSAGVPSVVVSLWSVPDQPTQALMTAFYGNLQTQVGQKPAVDKAQALRQAMLTVMKQYPDPSDWAGFMLIGSAD